MTFKEASRFQSRKNIFNESYKFEADLFSVKKKLVQL